MAAVEEKHALSNYYITSTSQQYMHSMMDSILCWGSGYMAVHGTIFSASDIIIFRVVAKAANLRPQFCSTMVLQYGPLIGDDGFLDGKKGSRTLV
jgi:hypothetical protein